MITKVLLPCLFINCYENYNPQKFGAKKAMTKKCNWGPWDSIASFASLYYSEVTFYHINRHIQIGTQAVGKFLSLCYTTAHWEGNTWEGGAIRGNVQFEAGNFGLCAATNNTEAEN